jgi:dTDP-4-amino-4,6-dideoxygalactose transaminase
MTQWKIPLFDVDFGAREEEAVLRPLRAGWLTMGREVQELESDLCAASGARHAIAVSNCTAALQMACSALDIGPGDEVLCPTLTFVATASAPVTLGAQVRFCESIGANDLTVDPDSIRENIGPRTKAILVVHYAGFACRMEPILSLAAAHDIPVIEDCAHSLFTFHRGKALGLHGRVGCFSFFSNKNITCGEGGALLTDDDLLAKKLRLLRSHGMTTLTLDRHEGHAHSYDVLMPGFNCRLDEIRAALLRAQLKKLPAYLERRRGLFCRYQDKLQGTPVTLPFFPGRDAQELASTSVHILSVLLPPGTDRASVANHLRQAGVQTSVHYPLVHTFSAYRGLAQKLQRTEALAKRQLTLPLYPGMHDADVDSVVDSLVKALDHASALAS